jgi:hypothetical protein
MPQGDEWVLEIALDGLYRDRNAIERKFGRLKDFRRIAFDTTATPTTSSSHVCLVAALCHCFRPVTIARHMVAQEPAGYQSLSGAPGRVAIF